MGRAGWCRPRGSLCKAPHFAEEICSSMISWLFYYVFSKVKMSATRDPAGKALPCVPWLLCAEPLGNFLLDSPPCCWPCVNRGEFLVGKALTGEFSPSFLPALCLLQRATSYFKTMWFWKSWWTWLSLVGCCISDAWVTAWGGPRDGCESSGSCDGA